VRPRLPAAFKIFVCVLVACVATAPGCAGPRPRRADWAGAEPDVTATAGASVPDGQAQPTGSAPKKPYRVGVRGLAVTRSPDRVLRTTIWYPSQAKAGGVAPGRFPIVVFSHGLAGLPADYQALATRWAAAGFVVVAPAYPHTSRGVAKLEVADVLNQPADASHVLTRILALDRAADDPLRGHLAPDRIAAAGHSAGAITTVGLFANGRDPRLDAGIVLAGNAIGMGNAYVGRPAALLFVHGDRDPVTPYSLGRATYAAVPGAWPKAFLTLSGERHIDPYVYPDTPTFPALAATTTDFLRWTLYSDPGAKARIAKDAGKGTRLDGQF
jgi:dienelactone hydrolase